MTKEEVLDNIGNFGQIDFNGRFYPSIVHGWLKEINGSKVTITRIPGNPIILPYKDIKSFEEKPRKNK